MIALDLPRRPHRRPSIARTPILLVAFATALLLALPGIVVAGF